MALQRGYGDGVVVTGASSQRGPRTFWLPPGTETTVVMLDGDPIEIVRHMLFLKGDKTAARMRQTCWGMNPREHPEPCPRSCQVCNYALSAPRQIGRKMLLCSTMIDERQFNWQGMSFKDMKMLLELNHDSADSWRQKKKAFGEIQWRRFRVYRSKAPQGKPQTSPRHGDNWQDLGRVDPMRHFWHSPAVPKLMEAAARRGEPIDHQTAVQRLITPIDYETEIGVYKPEEAEAFVAYLEGRTGGFGSGGGGGGIHVPAGGGSTPPPPPSSLPSYAATPGVPAGYPPTSAVPPDAVPSTPGAYVPPGPAPVAPPTAPAGTYAPPPPVPDPVAAGGQGVPHGHLPPPMPPPMSPAPAQTGPPAPTTPPWQPALPAAPPAPMGGVPGMPPTPYTTTPQESVPRLPAHPPAAPVPTQPVAGAYAPPAPPPGMPPAMPTPAPMGGGYAPPTGPPVGGPVPPPVGAPAPAPAPAAAAAPGAGFDFRAGWGQTPPGMPSAAPPQHDPTGF